MIETPQYCLADTLIQVDPSGLVDLGIGRLLFHRCVHTDSDSVDPGMTQPPRQLHFSFHDVRTAERLLGLGEQGMVYSGFQAMPCHRATQTKQTWLLGVFVDSLAPVSSSGSLVWRCALVCPRRNDLQIVLSE